MHVLFIRRLQGLTDKCVDCVEVDSMSSSMCQIKKIELSFVGIQDLFPDENMSKRYFLTKSGGTGSVYPVHIEPASQSANTIWGVTNLRGIMNR